MNILVDTTEGDFTNNKMLLSKYPKRYLEAVYELLSDKKLGKRVAKLLIGQDLVNFTVEEDKLSGAWSGYKQKYMIITLKETATLWKI